MKKNNRPNKPNKQSQSIKMRKETKHPILSALEFNFSYRFKENAAAYFTEFLNDEYSLGHKEHFPCPACFKKDSVRCYRSNNNGEIRGVKCDCGFERTMKDELHDTINNILYYTSADDSTSIEIAKHLYDIFTERIDSVYAKRKNNHCG